jgi:hypothetical protein
MQKPVKESLLDLNARIDGLIKKFKAEGRNMKDAYNMIKREFQGTPNFNPAWLAKYVRRAYVMGESAKPSRLGAPSNKPAEMMAQFVSELKAQENDRLPTYSYAKPMQINPIHQKRKASVRPVSFMRGI